MRRVAALLLVAALATPALALTKRVAVRVDGDVHRIQTQADTVGEVIADQGIVLAAGDLILPAPYQRLGDGTEIRVLRTVSVQLQLDHDRPRTLRGTFRTVGGALAAAGITQLAGLAVFPDLRSPLHDGATLIVRTPRTVTLTVAGRSQQVTTLLPDVGMLLADQGIEVGPQDLVLPDRDAAVVDGMDVVVRRVAFDEVVDEVTLDYATERRETDELFEGQRRTVQDGRNGLRHDIYRIRTVDGEETDRELVRQEIVREPTTRIIEEGTRPRPVADPDDEGIWYRLAQCESHGNWQLDGRFDGGLQFHPDTWLRHRLAGYPDYAWQATPQQQIAVGKRVQSSQGWRAWPHCARQLGLIS